MHCVFKNEVYKLINEFELCCVCVYISKEEVPEIQFGSPLLR
jgi:hypothetical protein